MAKGKVARIDVGGIFVLRWKTSSMLFMKFHIREEDVVHVHGCTGAASYVDKEITRNEARDYWKGLVADGWAQCHDMKVVPRDWCFGIELPPICAGAISLPAFSQRRLT